MTYAQKIELAWNDLELAVNNHDLKRATQLIFILRAYLKKTQDELGMSDEEAEANLHLPIIS